MVSSDFLLLLRRPSSLSVQIPISLLIINLFNHRLITSKLTSLQAVESSIERSASDHLGIGISDLKVELLGAVPDLLADGGVLNTGRATFFSIVEGSGVLALPSGEFFTFSWFQSTSAGAILSKTAGWTSSVSHSSGISSFLATPALIVISKV